jgi:hypothetical protein
MNRAQRRVAHTQGNLPPFDLVFCHDDPDEIIFVFGSESTKDFVQSLFPDLLLDKNEIGWVGCVTREWARKMAFEATEAGLKAAFGEERDGILNLQAVSID